MEILYEFSRKGDGESNEDIYGKAGKYAWVIDGATDVFQSNVLKKKHEVSWYVAQLNKELLIQCTNSSLTGDLKKMLKDAVGSLYDKLSEKFDLTAVEDYMLPTYAIAMVCIDGNIMKYYILGDCSISLYQNGIIESLRDKRITNYSLDNRKKLKEFMNATKSLDVPLSIYRETRAKANADNGYPIGMITGRGIDQGIVGTRVLSCGDKILMYSDGLLDFLNHDNNALRRLFDQKTINTEITKMYDYLGDVEQYRAEPRPKKIDDSTLLLLEVD